MSDDRNQTVINFYQDQGTDYEPCAREHLPGRVCVRPDGHGPLINEQDRQTRAQGVLDFLNYVASNAAYNGAPDPGQRFYDNSLNPWLMSVAEEFLQHEVELAEWLPNRGQ